ncbi:TetR/AcrR family transcriptional regulator [Microbacterium sp. SS28]|uniref:TetR/AcrR family transcriptional regulator n=1 Tax=Microbacterium sp. SS28 TaxID=2919948 RepID=UPI001FAB0081|nr:TetR/AcrR family transcriptional regulator [Microbacterium sp. SS28]
MAPEPAELDLPRGVALAWGIAADPQRGPKREMSVERIVEAAVEIADAEGLGAVSMAAVAARLGYTPMSLYRYVSAKDDLVLLMQEEATGLPPHAISELDGWRARLEAFYGALVQGYLRHPWVLDVPISGSPTTPNSAAWMDAGLATLAQTPLTHDERLALVLVITGHAYWTGRVLAGYARVQRSTGEGEADIARREDALYRELITADAFPHLRAAVDDGVFLDDSDPFSFGVARTLDGAEAYMETRAAGGPLEKKQSWIVDPDAEVASDKRFREARKGVRDAERTLRDARRHERQVAREAAERARRAAPDS